MMESIRGMMPIAMENVGKSLVAFMLCFICFTASSQSAERWIWERSTADEEGISTAVLDEVHQDIQSGKYGLIDHFLVVRNGKLVFDQAYEQDYQTIAKQYDTTYHQYNYDHPDWHPFYQGTSLHSLQSVTKSVTSLLMGIAMDEGLEIQIALR